MNFKTLDLAIQFNHHIQHIKVAGHLRDQLHRAASSIALNLAEGAAKSSAKEKRRYYRTAYGSTKECQVIFMLLNSKNIEVIQLADYLGASIYKLIHSNLSSFE